MARVGEQGRRLAARSILAIAVVLAAGAGQSESYGGDAVRVGLTTPPYTSPQSVTVTCTSDYCVIDLETDSLLDRREAGSVWIATTHVPSGSDKPQSFRIRIKPEDADGLVEIIAPAAAHNRYRGALEIRTTPTGTLRLVNEVPIEDYLRGVVASEMPASFELDALKAQAVAARTYALHGLARHAADGYNVCDGVCCQVYGGAAVEKERTDRAVAETRGRILTHNRQPILAMYHSDCGGITEAAANVGPAEGESYLRSVKDAPTDGGPEFCVNGHAHHWSLTLTGEAVGRVLASCGHDVGDVGEIEIVSRDETGRVSRLQLRGDQGTAEIRATTFRLACGPTRIKSTNFTVAKTERGFEFTGIGYGHGLGMCQYGANGRAAAPYCQSWDTILKEYYAGAEIEILGEPGGSLSGIVQQAGSAAPIASARVRIVGTGKETTSDEQGRFYLDGLCAGVYDLRFDGDGCRTLWQCNVRVTPGAAVELCAALEPAANPLDPTSPGSLGRR
jgi:stage II sporulation protein D